MKIFKLAVSILVSLAAGFIGSFFTASSVSTWYNTINKPFFNPPSWVFGPVWTVLYVLMGVAFYLVWQKKDSLAIGLFIFQLVLNSLWSIIFFGLRNPFLAFLEIILLWGVLLYMIIVFFKVDKRAGWLLVPYILWVSFAAVLNFSIWLLN